jgi:hypothetical protein
VIRRSVRIGLLLGLLAAIGFALAKVFGSHADDGTGALPAPTEPWPRLTADPAVPAPATARALPDPAAPPPEPAENAPARKKAPAKVWVEPKGGVCPTSHPVKAKLASKIFHLPGMRDYERMNPDRCYADAAKAEADGLRAAKR